MFNLWFILAIGYVIAGSVIYLDHAFRFPNLWNWNQAWYHEAFFITAIWVGIVYLTVAISEYMVRRKRPQEVSG